MNKKFYEKIKNILALQKKDILKLQNTDADIDCHGDETDEIQAAMIMDLTNKLNSRNTNKLIQIENALAKIKDNSYGLCDDCGEMISEKRLLANPHFLTCIFCAENREFEDKQRKRI